MDKLTDARSEEYYCVTNFSAKITFLLDITKTLTNKIFILMDKRKITLKELYQEKLQEKQISPANQLLQDIMEVTHRSEVTVRMWIKGKFKPEPIIIKLIADKLGVDANALFPEEGKEVEDGK